MSTKARLHSMIDELPEDTLAEAERLLDALHDPVRRALETAEYDDELETPEERAAVEEARIDIAAGRLYSHEEALRQLRERQ